MQMPITTVVVLTTTIISAKAATQPKHRLHFQQVQCGSRCLLCCVNLPQSPLALLSSAHNSLWLKLCLSLVKNKFCTTFSSFIFFISGHLGGCWLGCSSVCSFYVQAGQCREEAFRSKSQPLMFLSQLKLDQSSDETVPAFSNCSQKILAGISSGQ